MSGGCGEGQVEVGSAALGVAREARELGSHAQGVRVVRIRGEELVHGLARLVEFARGDEGGDMGELELRVRGSRGGELSELVRRGGRVALVEEGCRAPHGFYFLLLRGRLFWRGLRLGFPRGLGAPWAGAGRRCKKLKTEMAKTDARAATIRTEACAALGWPALFVDRKRKEAREPRRLSMIFFLHTLIQRLGRSILSRAPPFYKVE